MLTNTCVKKPEAWEFLGVREDVGYPVYEDDYLSGHHKGAIVGEKAVIAYLREYITLFYIRPTLEAYWGFDKDGKLIEIDIREYHDFL